jgi:oxygen-independent coproporphyrinogen III oxidase
MRFGHVSLYMLQLEEGTPFYKKYSRHQELLPSETEVAEMYSLAQSRLNAAGIH